MICQNSSNSATGWPLLLVVTFWLATRIQFVQFNPYATSKSFSIIISSELLSIPDRLSFIWSATRDAVIRRCQINPTYRYGLQFEVKNNYLHLLLLILLSGNIATNPGPINNHHFDVCHSMRKVLEVTLNYLMGH